MEGRFGRDKDATRRLANIAGRAQGGVGHYRKPGTSLQHRAPTCLFGIAAASAGGLHAGTEHLIPTLIDQHSCAQGRSPMETMRQG